MLPHCSIDPHIASLMASRNSPCQDALERFLRRIANRHIIVDPLANSTGNDDFGAVIQVHLGVACRNPAWNWIILKRPYSDRITKHINKNKDSSYCNTPALRHLVAAILDVKVSVLYMLQDTFDKLVGYLGRDSSTADERIILNDMRKKAVICEPCGADIIIKGPLAAIERCSFLFSVKWREDGQNGSCLGIHLHAHNLDDVFTYILSPLAQLFEDIYWFEPHLYGGKEDCYNQRIEGDQYIICKKLVELKRVSRVGMGDMSLHIVSANKPPGVDVKAAYLRRTEELRKRLNYKNVYCDYLAHVVDGKKWHDRMLVFRTKGKKPVQSDFVALIFSAPLSAKNNRLGPGLCGYRCPDDDELLPCEIVDDMLAGINKFEECDNRGQR